MAALSTALIIGGIAAAAGSTAKGVMQAHAAGEASKQQQSGAEKAAGYTQQGLNRSLGFYSPYVNQGASTMNTLGRLTTPGGGARYASPGPPNAMAGYMNPPPMPGGPSGPGRANTGPAMDGPYPMARGGDFMVNKPTMFIAGEAGPERATFSGAMPSVPSPYPGGNAPSMSQVLLQKYAQQDAAKAAGRNAYQAVASAPAGPPPRPQGAQGGPPQTPPVPPPGVARPF